MSLENFTFKGADGREVYTWCWNTPDQPLGILQIFHGMAEHARRYANLAQYLNARGFTVVACDLRGHGKTGELNGNSCHMDKEGFYGIVEDQSLLLKKMKEKYPGIPVFVLGHSFGSFLAGEFIKVYGRDISGVILSGSCLMNGVDVKAGYILAKLSLVFGSRRPNKLLDKLSFGSFNKEIRNPTSKFNWLSHDEAQVKIYEEDPFCGNVMSSGFFSCFFKGLIGLYDGMDKVPKSLPVFFVSGAEDPVGKYGVGVQKLYEEYKKLDVTDLQLKLYPGCRHEIINEIIHSEVYYDISVWLEKHI